MPSAFSSRTVSSMVTVLRANRLMDLVRIRSIFPARQSESICRNLGLSPFVPVYASSAYTPAYSQPGWLWI